MTIFASNGNARTFNYQAGDVAVILKNHAHYVENIGDEEVEMLEMFRAPRFEDFSVEQWLAQTPRITVAEHMNLKGERGDKFLDGLSKSPAAVKPGLKKSKSFNDAI